MYLASGQCLDAHFRNLSAANSRSVTAAFSISERYARSGEDSLILVCGPPGMMNHISGDKAKDRSQGELTGILKELGYTAEMVYKF